MNKRHLHHVWTKFRLVRPWYFLVLALISGAICVSALRSNNEQMIKLRNVVYAADKAGSDVQAPLKALQSYVTTHMNTNLSAGPNAVYPPIQLKYTYDRIVQAESDQLAQANSQLYTAAQAYCEALNHTDFSGHNRVPCIEQYVQSHTNQSVNVPDALYKFDFVSPIWSPDLAGWSLVVTVLSALCFVISLIAKWWLKRAAK